MLPSPGSNTGRPPLLWEHRYLLIIFVLALIVTTVLLFRAPHKQLTIEPPPVLTDLRRTDVRRALSSRRERAAEQPHMVCVGLSPPSAPAR